MIVNMYYNENTLTHGGAWMGILGEDFITITQATEVATSSGKRLSRSQIHHLCKGGKLAAQKVGKAWVISRKSVEAYKPEETGFAAVWKKRRTEQAALDGEIKKAVSAAKAKVTPVITQGRRRTFVTVLDETTPGEKETSQAKAWREFFEAVNTSGEEIPAKFERINFTREIEL